MDYTIKRDGRIITLTEAECRDIYERVRRANWLEDLKQELDCYAMEFDEQAPGLVSWLGAHLEDALDTYERRLENGRGWDYAAYDALQALAEDYEGVEA